MKGNKSKWIRLMNPTDPDLIKNVAMCTYGIVNSGWFIGGIVNVDNNW